MRGQQGFSLVEVLIVALILAMLMGGGYLVLFTGQSTWFATDVSIQMQENLRKSIERMTAEIRETQLAHAQIFDGTGYDSTDVIRFSVPVICEAGGNLIDTNGDVAHWGAGLTWGCTTSGCMDANNDCTVLEYKYIEYRVDNDNRLIRRVLDDALVEVREDIFGQNISDFQIQVNGNVVTLNLTAEQKSATNRVTSAQKSIDIFLRN